MSKYLLDTNICVHFLKGEYDLQNKILKAGLLSCFLSEITIAELLYGVAYSSPERQLMNRQRVEGLKNSFSGRILPIAPCLEKYAEQKAQLRKIGRRVEDLDLFIGATSIVENLILVTRRIS